MSRATRAREYGRRAIMLTALLAFAAIAIFAQAGNAADQAGINPNAQAGSTETGIASWYGADFHGRRTSNGETYDKEKLTCAHRTLPFGSYVLVRDLDNGSSVVVRVNDRGPFAKDRIIDLSEAAARIIGMIPTGTARVSIAVIPAAEALAWKGGPLAGEAETDIRRAPVPDAPQAPAGARVRIQVASYTSEANAKATLERLTASGLSATIERAGDRFRVVFPDLSPDESRIVAQKLDGLGYRGYMLTTSTPIPQ
jgi:rare lipoprotein A